MSTKLGPRIGLRSHQSPYTACSVIGWGRRYRLETHTASPPGATTPCATVTTYTRAVLVDHRGTQLAGTSDESSSPHFGDTRLFNRTSDAREALATHAPNEQAHGVLLFELKFDGSYHPLASAQAPSTRSHGYSFSSELSVSGSSNLGRILPKCKSVNNCFSKLFPVGRPPDSAYAGINLKLHRIEFAAVAAFMKSSNALLAAVIALLVNDSYATLALEIADGLMSFGVFVFVRGDLPLAVHEGHETQRGSTASFSSVLSPAFDGGEK